MSDMTPDTGIPENPGLFRGARSPRVLAQSVALAEEGGPNLGKKALATCAVTALALVVWAGFIGIDDVTKAAGRVIPSGEPQTVRYQDGGTVSEILVSDGEIVEKGQTLIRFDSREAQGALDKMQLRRVEVGLLAAQLRALGRGGEPDFSFVQASYRQYVEKERLVFAALKELMEKRRRVLEAKVTDTQTKMDRIDKQEKKLSQNADILEEELLLREDLFKKGLTPKNLYVKTKRQVDKAYKDLANLADTRQVTGKALGEAKNRYQALEPRLKERALDELAILTEQLDAINDSLEGLKERMDRLQVTAPAQGVVQGAHVHPLGTTVAPGKVVVEIIPLGGDAIVEARIAVADIDRVRAGQPVTVNVKAAGFSRYAALKGTLKEISSSTFGGGEGGAYYKGIIALERDFVGRGREKKRLMPGMDVEARIKTGSTTLLGFLLDSIAGS
ncbi:MAG: HlyD family type I secretion periplasmic adaptor subunit [Proteobacteria bacterium]|nr:HlyD family type I secretion periplasmic adaptor subunit [Pseudomonadota bacterium]